MALDVAGRDYPSIETQILLYTNDYFDNYVSWLNGLAENHVTDNAPLTANNLANFQSRINKYDGWSLHINHHHQTISQQGQAASVCIYRERRSFDVQSPGMQCVSVWAQSNNYVDTYLTYWIPWQIV